jgi:hypothetical protein
MSEHAASTSFIRLVNAAGARTTWFRKRSSDRQPAWSGWRVPAFPFKSH